MTAKETRPDAQETENKPGSKARGKKKPRKITPDYLHNAGLFYLQRYAASTGHFRKVMRRKIGRSVAFHGEPDLNTCHDLLEDLIVNFTRSGLLNDNVYAEGMVKSFRRKGLSTRALYARLQSKGLGADQIRAALAAAGEDCRQTENFAALRFAQRKRLGPFRTSPLISESGDERFSQKELAAFARGGFSYDLARSILEMSAEEAEDLLRQSG